MAPGNDWVSASGSELGTASRKADKPGLTFPITEAAPAPARATLMQCGDYEGLTSPGPCQGKGGGEEHSSWWAQRERCGGQVQGQGRRGKGGLGCGVGDSEATAAPQRGNEHSASASEPPDLSNGGGWFHECIFKKKKKPPPS